MERAKFTDKNITHIMQTFTIISAVSDDTH